MTQPSISKDKNSKEEVLVFGKPDPKDSEFISKHGKHKMGGGGGGGIQVLRKGPKQADGSHNITQIGGDNNTGGFQVHSVGSDGLYRDQDGNVQLDPTDEKELLHLKRRG
eukprot:971350_1